MAVALAVRNGVGVNIGIGIQYGTTCLIDDLCQIRVQGLNKCRDVMSVTWRRPSAFPTDNELSPSQTDEIRVKSSPIDKRSSEQATVQLSEVKKKWTIWTI